MSVLNPVATPSPDAASSHEKALRATARALGGAGGAGGGLGAAKLIGLLYNPDVDIDRVVATLRNDPALTARVLKVANSPYYRLSGHVGTIERAVQLLGLAAIRGVAAAGCLDRLSQPRQGQAFDPERFRRHSLAVACAGQMLSNAGGCGIDGEAFIAGLLHEMGLLLMCKHAPAAMASFAPPEGMDIKATRAAERAHFGYTHEDCAALLVDTWGLPAWLRDAVADHHEKVAPQPSGLTALGTIVSLAHEVADSAGLGLRPPGPPSVDEALAQSVRLDLEAMARVAAELPETMARMSAY